MQRIKYGDTYAMRVKVKRVIKGEEVDFDLSKCKGMSAELIGAVKRYPLTIAASGNIITADIDTSIFPEPDTDEGTAFALSVKGYEKGQLWRILQNRFLVVMPADWSPSSGGGDCDCEEALAEIRTKNTEQDGDITACEKKNDEQDKRLDEIEDVDKRQDKRLNTLRVLPFDGQTPAADGASGLYYDEAQGKFVAVNSTDAFTAKGCKETDYNDAKTAKALETQLYLCGAKLHKIEGGKLQEYCAEEKAEIETLRKRSDTLRVLPFDGLMLNGAATTDSGVLYDESNRKFVSKGDTDAFAAHGYSESDYNATDGEGNVTPIAANLYAMSNAEIAAQFGTLWAITSETLTWQKTDWEAGSLLPLLVKTEACETKNTEQDDRLTALEEKTSTRCSYVKLVSAAGGTVLVDGYEVDIPAGKMAVVFPDSSFKTNGTTCEYINVNHLNTEGWESFEGMFENFAGKTLDLTALNWESVKGSANMFENCSMLYDLQLAKRWHPARNAVLDFTGIANWTAESLQTNLVNNSTMWGGGLRGKASLSLDINAYDRLTADDLQTLTNKGYTVEADGSDENRIESMTWGEEIKDE